MEQADQPTPSQTVPAIGSPSTPEGFVEGTGISLSDVRVGYPLEAASFDGKWYYGKIVYVDESDDTFLVHFDGWNTRFDEWYKYTSKKVRPLPPDTDLNRKKVSTYRPGDNALAKWIDEKYYMCHVVRPKPGDRYEVRFEDGVLHTVDVSKLKIADKIDELTESARLLKQQETIERAKSREQRLKRRSMLHSENSSLPRLVGSFSLNKMVSELLCLEEGLRLCVSVPLSEVYLGCGETDEQHPSLSRLSGKTLSVRSFSEVLGRDLMHLAEPDSDVISTAPSSPLMHSGTKRPSSSASQHTGTDGMQPEPVQAEPDSPPPPPVPISEVADTLSLTPLQLLPITQPSPPILSSYAPPVPYTETVVTADGRILTLTPSYQPPPPAPVPDVTPQPLYYQLVPIQLNTPNNTSSAIGISSVDQSYLTVQQSYSYPYTTQYAPMVQQFPTSVVPHSLSLPSNLAPISAAFPAQLQTMDVQPQDSAPSAYSDLVLPQPPSQAYEIPDTLTRPDVPPQTGDGEEAWDVISDSESDKALFIDVQSADQLKYASEAPSSHARNASLSEEEIENRELRKLRLPDHNRKVAPRELVNILDTEQFPCERPGCSKVFHRRESLKKHLRVFHGTSVLHKKARSADKPHSLIEPLSAHFSTPDQFPPSCEHSITRTELLFKSPHSSHRSKRKSSQPRKSSFPLPDTPTVTIVIPSDQPEVPAVPPTPPETPQGTNKAPQLSSTPTPARQSKRISIKKNWDFDYKTPDRKKDKLDKHDTLKSPRKEIRSRLNNPASQQELKERPALKLKPPTQLSEEPASRGTAETARTEETAKERQDETFLSHSDTVYIEGDEQSDVIEEMQTDIMLDSPINIIDLMETSAAEPGPPTPATPAVGEHNSEPMYETTDSEMDDDLSMVASVASINPQELIRCVCGQEKDEGVMVQCEQCMTWQHTSCMGLSEKDLPDQHICSECSDAPASIKREQYKHSNPWYQSGKLMFPTDTELVETGAQLSSLKNQLASLEDMLPAVNLKIQIAKNGNHPYLNEFKTSNCHMLSTDEIDEKVASLAYMSSRVSQSKSDSVSRCFDSGVSEGQVDVPTNSPMRNLNQEIESSDANELQRNTEVQIQQPNGTHGDNTNTIVDCTDTNINPLLIEENVDPNLTSLMVALNESDWGCQMRLLDNIERIQSRLLSQFSYIEESVDSLRCRIPDSNSTSFNEMLKTLNSIQTNLS